MVSIVKYEDLALANEHLDSINKHKKIKKIFFCENKDILSKLLQIDMFNEINTYYIYDCDFLSSLSSFENNIELLNVINKLKDDIDIFLFCKTKLLSNKEFKKLTNEFDVININSIDKKNKQTYVNNLLARKNISLSKFVYHHLINCLTNDYSILKNEINKIYNLISAGTNENELLSLICNYNEENVFYLIENILAKNHNIVWKIFNNLVERKVDEIAIINALASQLFNFYYICLLNNQNKSINDIASSIDVPTFIVISFKNKFNKIQCSDFKTMLLDLYDLEFNIKSSQLNKSLALKNQIIKWLAR